MDPTKNDIESVSLDNLLHNYGLNYVNIIKMDIEGSEDQVFFNSSLEFLNLIDMLFIEIHDNLKPGLTKKIKDIMKKDFNFYTREEYSAFERKNPRLW